MALSNVMGESDLITIHFNEEKLTLTARVTLSELLETKGPSNDFFAVAVNNQFIPRKHYSTMQLQHDDVVTIIIPMQGG